MRDEWTRSIWQGLVTYANTGKLDPGTLLDCLPWRSMVDGLDLPGSLKGRPSALFKQQAAKYHSSIAAVLRCSCDPKSRDIYLGEAQKFVREHNHHIDIAFTMLSAESPKCCHWVIEINGKFMDLSLLVFFGTRSYRDIADPIMGFLLEEHEKFLKGEYKEAIPIVVCANPACNKMVMPERVGKRKFCSDACKALERRRIIPQKQRTDYQWAHRLWKMPPAPRLKALRNRENRERLKRIKAEQDYGPACQELIRNLEGLT
jgi:hypothetical protein